MPWRPGPTDEDPSAPVEERIRRFGQADHVRWYGYDFEDRLRAAGLVVRRVRPDEIADPTVLSALGSPGDEAFWLCARSADALPTVAAMRAQVARWVTETLAAGLSSRTAAERLASAREEVRRMRRERDRAQRKAERWRRRHRTLRSRPGVRLIERVSRRLGRLRARER